MVFEAVKIDLNNDNEYCEVCFSNEEAAIQYVSKYLGGVGCVRVREYTTKRKIYNSLEEYEEDFEYNLAM